MGPNKAAPPAPSVSSSSGIAAIEEDPFWLPPEMVSFAEKKVSAAKDPNDKAEKLLQALMLPEDQGGLGITFASDRTRTVNEVWKDRKANCLSLTISYVMLAEKFKIRAAFAESADVMGWSRVGGFVLKSRHVVAVVMEKPNEELVADFLPRILPRFGNYFVNIISTRHGKSQYYSNCSVESLLAGDVAAGKALIEKALEIDPDSSQAWNIKGVIEKYLKNTDAAFQAFRRAIRLNPKDAAAIGNLAGLYRAEGQFEEYTKLKAVENRLRKNDPYYFAFLSVEALEGDKAKTAAKLINKAIKLQPKDPDFFIILCSAFELQNKIPEALKALEKAKELSLPDRQLIMDAIIEDFKTRHRLAKADG
ncbi:MAG: tetratricopeptide repeat protein [Holophagales bacterium]|jgi:Tfp pilus assembly protein PilF|nr:tetratricopeptide repeat protein [Holophagales bacterium]